MAHGGDRKLLQQWWFAPHLNPFSAKGEGRGSGGGSGDGCSSCRLPDPSRVNGGWKLVCEGVAHGLLKDESYPAYGWLLAWWMW
jgi:hypothetical protein